MPDDNKPREKIGHLESVDSSSERKIELDEESEEGTVGGYRIFKQDKDRDPQDSRDATCDRHYWR